MNLRVFYLYKTVGFGWLRKKNKALTLYPVDINF